MGKTWTQSDKARESSFTRTVRKGKSCKSCGQKDGVPWTKDLNMDKRLKVNSNTLE